jgi:hypothetical protein
MGQDKVYTRVSDHPRCNCEALVQRFVEVIVSSCRFESTPTPLLHYIIHPSFLLSTSLRTTSIGNTHTFVDKKKWIEHERLFMVLHGAFLLPEKRRVLPGLAIESTSRKINLGITTTSANSLVAAKNH